MNGPLDDRLRFLAKIGTGPMDEKNIPRWRRRATDSDTAIGEKAIEILATRAPKGRPTCRPRAAAGRICDSADAGRCARPPRGRCGTELRRPPPAADRFRRPATRTAVLKILLGLGDHGAVIKRQHSFRRTLAGFVRDRALDSLREFGDALIEPVIELLHDPDPDMRSGAIAVAARFDDPRIVPATIDLLHDPDWWIRISAADTLGRLKDPRAVEPLIAALGRPRYEVGRRRSARPHRRSARFPALGNMLADPLPDVRIEVMQALRHFKHPQVQQRADFSVAQNDPDRAVRTHAIDILDELAPRTSKSQSRVDAIRKAALTVAGIARRAAAEHAADRHAQSRARPTSISPSASRRSSASPPTCCARRASRSPPRRPRRC